MRHQPRRSTQLVTLAAILVGILLGAPWRATAGPTDYLPDNLQWNGLSELVNLAESLDLQVELLEELDYNRMGQATLFVLYPLAQLEARDLFAFVEHGGAVLLADDFGAAGHLFESLGIQRQDSGSIRADRYHNSNPHLPVARIGAPHHPLARGVTEIIANHPAFFRSDFQTIVGFESEQQLVVTARLGRGRLVALSDPSILINAMLRFKGNALLATNLLAYLSQGSSKKIYLVTGHVRSLGAPVAPRHSDQPVQQFLSEYNDFLSRLNDFAATRPALHALAIGASSLCLVGLLLVLPLPRSDLKGHWTRPPREHDRRREMRLAAAVLREEIEEILTEMLDAPGPVFSIESQWVVRRVREQAGEEAAQLCGRIMIELRHIPPIYGPHHATTTVRVHRRQLARIYEQCRRLLALIGRGSLPQLTQEKL